MGEPSSEEGRYGDLCVEAFVGLCTVDRQPKEQVRVCRRSENAAHGELLDTFIDKAQSLLLFDSELCKNSTKASLKLSGYSHMHPCPPSTVFHLEPGRSS